MTAYTSERHNASARASVTLTPARSLPPFVLTIAIDDPEQVRDLLLALYGKNISWTRLNGLYNAIERALQDAGQDPDEMIKQGQQPVS